MTRLMHHTWLRPVLIVLAIAALLVATGSQLAGAKPVGEKSERDLDKEMCDLGGGAWWEFGSNYGCVFDDFELVCENDGADCKFCEPDKRCERIVDQTRRPESLEDDQKVLATDPTPTPNPRGRDRTPIADQPVVVAPVSTPTPESTKPVAPVTEPVRR